MSDVPNDPGAGPGATRQPTEEEMRAYLGKLRAAPADQVLAEVFSGLLNAAQVKVGRRDARLLLDAAATLVAQTRSALPSELVSQLDDVISQLRMAQVQAEPEVAEAAAQGQAEPNDLEAAPGGPGGPEAGDGPAGAGPSSAATPSQGTTPGSSAGPQGSPAASRLWVPGR